MGGTTPSHEDAMRVLRSGGATPSHEDAMRVLARYPYRNQCVTRNREETYGEVVDMQGLVARLPVPLTSSSVFVDVGSGHGRLSLYVALATAARAVVGVEISPCRFEKAESMLREVGPRAPHLRFHMGDVRTVGLPADTTHLFMCSTCFSKELCHDIVRAAPPSLQCFISLKALQIPGWVHHGSHTVECTWSKTSQARYYVRSSGS